MHAESVFGSSELLQEENSHVPNYKTPNELRVYSSAGMARRRMGVLEEQLRGTVIAYVKSGRVRNKDLAQAIGRSPSWVSEYMGRENHANLDTSLALMRALGWTLHANLREALQPVLDSELIVKLSDEPTRRQVESFLELDPAGREVLLHAHAVIARPKAGFAESKPEPMALPRTRRARGRRR